MRLLSPLLLTAIWLLALGRPQPADILVGLLLSLLLLRAFRRHVRSGEERPGLPILPFLRFMAGVGLRFLRDTVDTASLVLRGHRRGGVVRVPVGSRTALGVAVTGWAVTLTPGSVFLQARNGEMLFHTLDDRDPDGFRRDVEQFYERWQKPIFP